MVPLVFQSAIMKFENNSYHLGVITMFLRYNKKNNLSTSFFANLC